jgi:hypothetical protein
MSFLKKNPSIEAPEIVENTTGSTRIEMRGLPVQVSQKGRFNFRCRSFVINNILIIQYYNECKGGSNSNIALLC